MSQENLQTMIMQYFWGVKEVYYRIVQVVNCACIILSVVTCLFSVLYFVTY